MLQSIPRHILIKLCDNNGNTPYCFDTPVIVSSGLLSVNRSGRVCRYNNLFSIPYLKCRINPLPSLAICSGSCLISFCVLHATSYLSWNKSIISDKISGDFHKNSYSYRSCTLLPYGHDCYRLWHHIILYRMLSYLAYFRKTKIKEIFFEKITVSACSHFSNYKIL